MAWGLAASGFNNWTRRSPPLPRVHRRVTVQKLTTDVTDFTDSEQELLVAKLIVVGWGIDAYVRHSCLTRPLSRPDVGQECSTYDRTI